MALTRAAGLALGDAMDVVQEWNHLTESMEIDEVMDTKAEKRYLALDTNVLISALPLLKEFASFVEEHQLGVEFLIAGVVVEELDHLKKSGVGRIDGVTGQDLGLAARTASNWLLAGLRRRSQFGAGLIRGQAYHETRQSSANWKTRVNNESNDEVILDCCLHFSSSRKVYLFTMDKNFCNANLMNDIPIILYEPGWNFMRLYAAMTPELQNTVYGSIHVSTRQFAKQQATYAQPQMHAVHADESMAIDDEGPRHAPPPPPAEHPMDVAHLEMCAIALPALRKAAEHVVKIERERLIRGGREASIHSGTRNDGFEHVKLLPDVQALAAANVKECLTLIWRLTKATKTFNGLIPFLLPAGERGARRGREFSRGDWNAYGNEIKRLGNDAQYEDLVKLGDDIVAFYHRLCNVLGYPCN